MAKPKLMIETGAMPIMTRAHVKSAAGTVRAKLDPSRYVESHGAFAARFAAARFAAAMRPRLRPRAGDPDRFLRADDAGQHRRSGALCRRWDETKAWGEAGEGY